LESHLPQVLSSGMVSTLATHDTPSLARWLAAVSCFGRDPNARSESRLYHFDGAIFADFARPS